MYACSKWLFIYLAQGVIPYSFRESVFQSWLKNKALLLPFFSSGERGDDTSSSCEDDDDILAKISIESAEKVVVLSSQ